MDARFVKSLNALVPADSETAEWLAKVKIGTHIDAKVSQPRNPLFHRKLMALFTYAFDYWSETAKPLEYRGQPVQPSFERFRKDITILAGYGKPVVNIRGEVRFEADSISFGKMQQETFDKLYSAVLQVLLTRVFTDKRWNADELEQVVSGILEFAA